MRRRPTPPAKVVPSPEEKLNLVTSIDTCSFLKNIQEYGNNRMARRAVGVLQKMPAYRVYPQQEHYTEVIIACEKSDMYRLAVGVFEEMLSLQMEPTAATYAALISVAEKTDHYDEAVRFFHQMIERGKQLAHRPQHVLNTICMIKLLLLVLLLLLLLVMVMQASKAVWRPTTRC